MTHESDHEEIMRVRQHVHDLVEGLWLLRVRVELLERRARWHHGAFDVGLRVAVLACSIAALTVSLVR